MTTVADSKPAGRAALSEWIPVAAGLLVLYVPTFYGLSLWLWRQDEHAHGPIVLAVILWLLWRERAVLLAPSGRPAPGAGFVLLVAGLIAYVLGRSHEVAFLEVGALAPVLAGVVLAMRGWHALRILWFPILFVAFLVPLPGIFVDALTAPLKQAVSEVAVTLLHPAGYPIARDGVVITIGPYQLLVADACAGLNSMFSLSALGLLFVYLKGRASLAHNAVVLGLVLPIAFIANLVRVLLLILVTYHFGDEAGQGFLHGAAGIVLVTAALGLLLLADAALTLRVRAPRRRG